MDRFKRFGLYVVPEGALFEAGSAWLGWDSATGTTVEHPIVPGIDNAMDLTATPRKYGIHGTIKPPFGLATDYTPEGLHRAAAAFCGTRAPVSLPKVEVRRLGRFIAIVPSTPTDALADLAAAAVRDLDPFRAPPSEAELARRRAKRLSARQEALLTRWGYPYVMEEFRFHITLTGALQDPDAIQAALADHFAPLLDGPLEINSLALMGEHNDGLFHLIHRYTLSG
ncbi:DUF1045 domain-containing protein [Gymnodinialimonas sp. 2305UL16-5]|uniref:DUF1045 domain-containing protein n=1 Tax=Gymnodinialimonas mytili TaxID=3126503 RepID=UPI0030B42E3A